MRCASMGTPIAAGGRASVHCNHMLRRGDANLMQRCHPVALSHTSRPAPRLLSLSSPRAAGFSAPPSGRPGVLQIYSGTGALNDKEKKLAPPPNLTVSETRIYGWADWERHRGTQRYWQHLTQMPSSRIVKGLVPPVLWVIFCASAVCFYETACQMDLLPGFISHPRTDASYERWKNGRSNWTSVISGSREVMRLGCIYFTGDNAAEEKQQLARWLSASAWCLRDHLLRKTDLESHLMGLLEPHEREAVMASNHKPLFVFAVITELIHRGSGTREVGEAMLHAMAGLEAIMADSERILKTPIPLSYTRHTSRFLISYLTFLPLSLWDECSWYTVPISAVVAFFLLGIDEIGVQIEEPFSGLPLERYSATVETDCFAAMELHSKAQGVLDTTAAMQALMANNNNNHAASEAEA